MPDTVQYSEYTTVALRTLNLEHIVRQDPKKALLSIEECLDSPLGLEAIGVMAEISFKEGERYTKNRLVSEISGRKQMEWYLRAAHFAFQYLFNPQWNVERNPYSPPFQMVCHIYNQSTVEILRQALGNNKKDLNFTDRSTLIVDLPDASREITVGMQSQEWKLEDFEWFRFASDFEITGLKNRYRRYGLGVPLVAKCRDIHTKPQSYRYCLQELCVPMSAFLYFEEGVPKIEFIDSMECSTAKVGNVSIPLEIDYTTPLAYSFELTIQKNALDGATLGLLSPDALLQKTEDGSRQLKGIYMPQAYNPNKIPVVMVHGLWSSPMTWMEMYNTLNGVSWLREKYQFWFYFYPNGQPFWVSAAQFQDDLKELRTNLDPQRSNTNMDQMVLIGHSMGGLVSVLQTIDSKEHLWDAIMNIPPEELKGDPEANSEVARWFHITPNPSISCVITLGTPFRGSALANSTTQGLTGIMGRKASLVETSLAKFIKGNEAHIKNRQLLEFDTALTSLQKHSIFWDLLPLCEPAPWVKYHNIVGHLKSQDPGFNSDGVVSVESATFPWPNHDEKHVTALHREIGGSSEAILEVATILGERLPWETDSSADHPEINQNGNSQTLKENIPPQNGAFSTYKP